VTAEGAEESSERTPSVGFADSSPKGGATSRPYRVGTGVSPRYFNTRKTTIYGGSSEVQRNVLAKAMLGL